MRNVILGALAMFSAACSLIGSPGAGALSTDSTSYTARLVHRGPHFDRYEVTVVARYTNAARSSIFLANCGPTSRGPVYGVGLVSGKQSAFETAWGCVGHDQQLEVRAGETRVDTLRLTAPNAVNGITNEPLGVFEGVHRLSYDPQRCRGDGQCRIDDSSLRSSNTFSVRLPE